jgi:hypothetical protein
MSLGNTVFQVLSFLFMVSISLVPALALLYFYVSTFRSMCAVPNMAVFCSSFTIIIIIIIASRSRSRGACLFSPTL